MFCSNCGRPTDNPEGLCQACAGGPSVATEEFVLGTGGNAPKKSKKGLVIGIIAAVAAVAVGVGAFFLFGKEKDKGGIGGTAAEIAGKIDDDLSSLKYKTPQEQFVGVNSVYISNFTSGAASAYGQLMASMDASEDVKTGAEMELHVILGDSLLTMLESELDMDVQWLKDIALDVDYGVNGTMAQLGAGIGLGKSSILTLDLIMDLSEHVFYLGVPDLSSKYIELDIEELSGMDMDTMMEEAMSSEEMAAITQLAEILPEEKELAELVERYLTIALSEIQEVEADETTLEVAGVEQKCTVLRAQITEETVYNIGIALLKEAKGDKQLMALAQDVAELSGTELSNSDYTDAMEQGIMELEEELEYADSEDTIEIVEYVDKSNHIIGLEFVTPDYTAVEYYSVSDGDDFALEATVYDEYSDAVFVLAGDGTVNGDKITGEYVLTVEGDDMLVVNVDALSEDFMTDNQASGTITLYPSEDLLYEIAGISMDAALEIELDKGAVTISVLVDDEMLAALSFSGEEKTPGSIKAPADDNLVDANDENELMSWVIGLDISKLIDNAEKAGVPEELTEYLKQMLSMG